jgi:glutamate-1-semialdehyde aminotransferase
MTAEPAAPSRSLQRARQLDMNRRASQTLPGGTDSNETTDVLDTVRETGEHIQAGVRRLLDAKGQADVLTGRLSSFGIMFNDTVLPEYRDWADTDHEPSGDRGRYARVALCPSRTALVAALEARAIA